MKKISSIILLVICYSLLLPSEPVFGTSWERQIDGLLQNNSDYQQLLNRYEQEKAAARIDKSLGLFDINFAYQFYENEIDRNENTDAVDLEETKITEEDKRWQVELNRQFFPKDFDAAADAISSSIDLFRYEQELLIAKTEYLSDALDDIIDWQEVVQKSSLLNQKLDILFRENTILEEMLKNNLIGTEPLIENLEEIEDLEKDISDLEESNSNFIHKYDALIVYEGLFEYLAQQNSSPDTILFLQVVDEKRNGLISKSQRIFRKIKFHYFQIYLPEVNLSLSYNWRETNQDWDITKNGNLKNMLRDQNEQYPEAQIEFSLPFNIFSNISGKYALLKAYRNELLYRFGELRVDWQDFRTERLQSYRIAQQRLDRKQRMQELYADNLHIFQKKFEAEPTLLGRTPELKLQKETIKTAEAELDYKIAEMKYYKEIFLINRFGEEAK